jgi:hypothetical protein
MKLSFLSKTMIFSVLALLNLGMVATQASIPLTGSGTTRSNLMDGLPTLQEFKASLPTGNQIVGLYTASFAYPVLQQPKGSPAFVSTEPDKVTQFALASQYGSTGILAHNHLAGAAFSELSTGETITLVYGDGHVQNYKVKAIERFQALTPTSPTSNFLSLDQTPVRYTASGLFDQIYNIPQRLVLQTCIKSNGNPSWGRLFIIAEPDAVPSALASFANWWIGTSITAN